MIEHYRTIQLDSEFTAAVEEMIDAALADQAGTQRLLRNQLKNQLNRLSVKADNLVDLVADGGLAASKAGDRIRAIERERAEITTRLSQVTDDLSVGAEYIRGWLKLLNDPYEMYRTANDEMRRRLNQAIFTHIWVVDADRAESELTEPARLLIDAQRQWAALASDRKKRPSLEGADADSSETVEDLLGPMDLAFGSSKRSVVPLEGFEPPTRSLGRSGSSTELQRLALRV